MNRLSVGYIIASVIIILTQVLLLKNIQIGIFERFTLSIIIYPAVIIFLPLWVRRSIIVLAAFLIGLFIDMFYDSPGVHTAALVLTAFVRTFILKMLEPRKGYRTNVPMGPKDFGLNWFLTYLGIMLFIHTFVYFSIDAFTFVFILKILVNSIISFILSYLILILYKVLI